MSDLLQRMRFEWPLPYRYIIREAADRIEELEKALQEIAEMKAVWGPEEWPRWHIEISPFQIAQRALESK